MRSKISTFFVLLLTILTLSCVDNADGKQRKIGGNSEGRVATQIQAAVLTAPDPQGLSHNAITVKLKDNNLPKIIFLDLQFDAGNFKLMNVKLPAIAAEGCNERPEIAKWIPQSPQKNGHEPLEMYSRAYGWSPNVTEPWIDCIYDVDQDIGSRGGQQTVSLRFTAAKTCIRLRVMVDVQFKSAGG